MASFSAVTALSPSGTGGFAVDVDAKWTIGGKPNGGYLLAMIGRAATLVGEHPHVLAASAHYLRAPVPGPAEVEMQVLRTGRSSSQLAGRLRQDGRSCVEALVTTSTLHPDSEPVWTDGVPDPFGDGPALLDDAVRLPGTNAANGLRVTIMEQVDLRLDRSSLRWAVGRPRGQGELYGWLTLPDGEAFDPVSLLYAVDAFPPATFDIAPSGWVPTLEYGVHVRALPAPGPLRILQKVRMIEADLVDEACWAWDSRGRLVAHGTQLAGVRLQQG